jgi:hypothetical protein
MGISGIAAAAARTLQDRFALKFSAPRQQQRTNAKRSTSNAATRRTRALARRQTTPRGADCDEALKVFLQNLLDSMLIAFMWEFSRWWLVRVD